MAPRRCNFRHPRFEGGQCPRPARRGWTMCPSHYSAGRAYAKPICPQSGDHAPVNTDPTGHFECSHCGKLLVATYRRHMVPKHQARVTVPD